MAKGTSKRSGESNVKPAPEVLEGQRERLARDPKNYSQHFGASGYKIPLSPAQLRLAAAKEATDALSEQFPFEDNSSRS